MALSEEQLHEKALDDENIHMQLMVAGDGENYPVGERVVAWVRECVRGRRRVAVHYAARMQHSVCGMLWGVFSNMPNTVVPTLHSSRCFLFNRWLVTSCACATLALWSPLAR